MKTAMQEAIELVKKYDNREIPFNVMLFNLELLLEKEKEQIIEAHKSGWIDCQQHIMTIGETSRLGEDYYNQTYNQNK
jgi:hypothetical protein